VITHERPSLTKRRTVCRQTTSKLDASGPLANRLVWQSAYQKNCKGSCSTSHDCEPSRTTRAPAPSGERMNRLVSPGRMPNSGDTVATAKGASFTGTTVMLTVATADVNTPSLTWKLKLSG